MIVLDASAAVHFLIGGAAAEWVAGQVDDEHVQAPHLIDVEVSSALRTLVKRGELGEERGHAALANLVELELDRHPHAPFFERVWELRDALGAYDAVYVALAEALDCPLVTTDARIARAPGVQARVLAPPS